MTDPTDAEPDAVMAEAERLFANAVRANNGWRDFNDIKATPPWWVVGVECVWCLLGPKDKLSANLSSATYRDQLTPILRRLSDLVFDRFLATYQRRRLGELFTGESFHSAFADDAEIELLPRVADLAFSASVAPEQTAKDNPGRVDDSVLNPPMENPVQHSPAICRADELAERKELRDGYKAQCKAAGVKITNEMISRAANTNWHNRTPVEKWLQGDPRYDGEPDRLIREVIRKKPHLPKHS